jgi:divalent metal cation (Fe/Co/Zn/Cd) transporter
MDAIDNIAALMERASSVGFEYTHAVSSAALIRRGLQLEYATLMWNVVGTAVLVFSARAADSIALGGFALDSAIEIFASLVVVWQLTGAHGARERRAMFLIGIAFLAVGAYVLITSLHDLITGPAAQPSALGIGWVAATVAAMLLLARGKLRVGARLENPVLIAESRVTMIDAALATAVLMGLVANAAFSWRWADPAAGLVIVYYALREGASVLSDHATAG